MNRNIKFRAWDKHEGKWLFGYEYPNLGGFSLIGEVVLFGELAKFSLDYYQHIVFMQCTGLKDRKGKDIYEGDILKVWKQKADVMMEYAYPMPVMYCELWCQFVLDNPPAKEQYGIWTDFDQFEVIGNIYENKDLLTYC